MESSSLGKCLLLIITDFHIVTFDCRLADLMDEHKEELATIESIDSGAVYTLALKTHVGMSIETWRYFAGIFNLFFNYFMK